VRHIQCFSNNFNGVLGLTEHNGQDVVNFIIEFLLAAAAAADVGMITAYFLAGDNIHSVF